MRAERELKSEWLERVWSRLVPPLMRRTSADGVRFRLRTTSFDSFALTVLLGAVVLVMPAIWLQRHAAADPGLHRPATMWTVASLVVAAIAALQGSAHRVVSVDFHRVMVRGRFARESTLATMTLRIEPVVHRYRWYGLQTLASSDRNSQALRQRFDVALRSDDGAMVVLPVQLPTVAEVRALVDELRAAVDSVRVPAGGGYRDA